MKLPRPFASLAPVALVLALLLSACGASSDPLSGGSATPGGGSPAAGQIVVGSANFTESQVLAELYAQAMKAKGVDATTRPNIGSREVYLTALKDGSISVIPEYSGNLLLYFDKNNAAETQEEIEKALPGVIGNDLKVLDASQAQDQDVYVVTQEFSQQHGITSLADLKKIASDSVLGGPGELKERPYGPPGLDGIYGAKFKEFKAYDALAVKVKDLNDNKIQVATFFTTDAAIADNNYVKLEDPQHMILPQAVIPLVRADVASNQQAVDAIDAVQKALTTDELAQLNKAVDSEHKNPANVAGEWLKTKGLV